MSEGFIQNSEITLVGASGSDGGLGLITTVPAAATIYVRCDTDRNVAKVDWGVKSNKAHALQMYKARTNVTGGTITLTDATAVDDEDTFVFNGVTFVAETTPAEVDITNHEWAHAAQASGAAALAVLMADQTYGVKGIGTITVTAPTTTDVLTIAGGRAPCYQFGQGTSASNEIAWSETTLAGLTKHGAAITGIAADTTTSGSLYEQWCDGWPYCYIGYTNNDAADAATVVIKATRYWV